MQDESSVKKAKSVYSYMHPYFQDCDFFSSTSNIRERNKYKYNNRGEKKPLNESDDGVEKIMGQNANDNFNDEPEENSNAEELENSMSYEDACNN